MHFSAEDNLIKDKITLLKTLNTEEQEISDQFMRIAQNAEELKKM